MPNSLRPYPGALLNPCADPTFKMIFTSATEESHIALTEFLSDVIGKKITDVVLQPNELAGDFYGDKQPEFDITCKIDGQYANIELQGQNNDFSYGQRTEYHIAHLLNHYTPKGTDWSEIPQVYQISIMNFVFDRDEKDAVNHYWVQNKHGRKVGDRMHFIFIELPKIAKLPDSLKDLTKSEMWGKFFLYAPDEAKKDFINDLTDKTEGIKMAVSVLSSISDDEANWIRETHYWDRVSTEKTRSNAIKRRFQEGLRRANENGLKLGIKQGIEQGIVQGIEQGIEQGIMKTVKNLLSMGSLSTEQISQASGLSIEEVEKIKEKM